jgi:hypothetical protein
MEAQIEALEGETKLRFSVRINVREMAEWSPERMKQFFAGLAKMLEAANASHTG